MIPFTIGGSAQGMMEIAKSAPLIFVFLFRIRAITMEIISPIIITAMRIINEFLNAFINPLS